MNDFSEFGRPNRLDPLREMLRENAIAEEIWTARGPIDCPVCGLLLEIRAWDRLRHCPMGHYTYQGDQ